MLDLLQPVIDALTANAAVLDARGIIIGVNRSWQTFGTEHGLVSPRHGVGLSYLQVCLDAARSDPSVLEIHDGLLALTAGARTFFRTSYAMEVGGKTCHFIMTASPFEIGGERCVLVAHEDVTEVVEARDERRQGTLRLLETVERERKHIARELHESLCQQLTGIRLLSGLLGKADPEATEPLIEEISEVADEAMRMIRAFSFLLHPPEPSEQILESLEQFLLGFSRRTGLRVDFAPKIDRPEALKSIYIAIFRIIQEALANAHRHSGASMARVALEQAGDAVRLTIEDDGSGFDPEGLASRGLEGVGISGMRMRAAELGGTLEIESGARGSRLTATLPF